MATNPHCDIDVGTHETPFWIDKEKKLKVCSRHAKQYDESGYGPYHWELQTIGV